MLHLLQAYFRPELLNRLDEIVVFKQLSMADTGAIAQLLMQETRERIAQRGIGLEVTPALMRFICQEGHSEVRALRHTPACFDFLMQAPQGCLLLASAASCQPVTDCLPSRRVPEAQPVAPLGTASGGLQAA